MEATDQHLVGLKELLPGDRAQLLHLQTAALLGQEVLQVVGPETQGCLGHMAALGDMAA